VIAAGLRYLAIAASAFVALSFMFFATDQTSNASENSVKAINGNSGPPPESATKVPNPDKEIEKLREKENSGFHEFVDDVDDVLLSPFMSFVDDSSIWVQRLVPGAIALLLYGMGGLFLARAAAARRL
jgi:hypothetical protein